MKKLTCILLIATLGLSSCLTTRTAVGNYASTQGTTYTYAKGKQIWIFSGLIPIGRTSVATPPDGNCQVITKFSFGDVLIYGLSLGLVTTYTIKVKAKRGYAAYNPPIQSNPTPATPPSGSPAETPSSSEPATPTTPSIDPNSPLQAGEIAYMNNALGNAFAVTILSIEGGSAVVTYENAMGAQKTKRVALHELRRRP